MKDLEDREVNAEANQRYRVVRAGRGKVHNVFTRRHQDNAPSCVAQSGQNVLKAGRAIPAPGGVTVVRGLSNINYIRIAQRGLVKERGEDPPRCVLAGRDPTFKFLDVSTVSALWEACNFVTICGACCVQLRGHERAG